MKLVDFHDKLNAQLYPEVVAMNEYLNLICVTTWSPTH